MENLLFLGVPILKHIWLYDSQQNKTKLFKAIKTNESNFIIQPSTG